VEIIRGKVNIPKDYFNKTAKREYVFWARALIREFLQNSVDAGSSTIKFKFRRSHLSLVVQDDGCGMDKDIILSKLLALGGSHKQQGAVGGFGKAKEILFFAWNSYAIHTKCWLVEGEGSEYSVREVSQYYNGTRCVIYFYNEQEFNAALTAAIEYLPRNEVDADIYLNSSKVSYAFGSKKKVRQFKWGTIYTCDAFSKDVSVRVNGLEMHKRYTTSRLKNQIIAELNGYSTKVLVSNRDTINHKYSCEIQGFLSELAINPISATENFDEDIQEEIGGNRILVPKSLLMLWDTPVSQVPINGGIQGANVNKSVFNFPNFKYEFIVRRSKSFDKEVIKQFMADPISESLAKIWSSLIFEVVVANEIPIYSFRVGFIFNKKVRGLCMGKPELPTILINPLCKDITSSKKLKELKEVLEDVAYHEVAHISNRRHDEIFVMCAERYRLAHRKWRRKVFVRVFNWKKLIGGNDGRSFENTK